MSEKLKKELEKVDTKIKKRYFLIKFQNYETVFNDILKSCIKKYGEDSEKELVKAYYKELTKYFEPINSEIKQEITKNYMDNKFNFSVTTDMDLLNELKKLINYLKTYKLNEDYFLYDWIIQNYQELGILIKSLLVKNGLLNVKKIHITNDIMSFLQVAADILKIVVEGDIEVKNTTFKTSNLLKHSLLSKEKTNALFAKYHNGDITARDEIMAHNYRLVGRLANKFSLTLNLKSYTFDDLFQEGVFGLMTATERFDPELGYNFSTYAMWWIRQAMWRSYQDNDSERHVPIHIQEENYKVKKRKRELEMELGRKVTSKDLAKDLLMPISRVEEILNENNEVVSLQTRVSKDEDSDTLEYFIPSKINVEEEVINGLDSDNIDDILSGFKPQEVKIIKMRAGIGYPRTYTLAEIGKRYNVSRERIRQIEKKVRIKLNRKNIYVAQNYIASISSDTTKMKLNDYFLGISNNLLAAQIALLDDEKQKYIRHFYNRFYNLISFEQAGEFFYKEIVDPIFKALYEKDGRLNLDAIPEISAHSLKVYKNFGNVDLIIKRYGPNLDELNPLSIEEIKRLYSKQWPSFYNYCVKRKAKGKTAKLSLKERFSFLSEDELHSFIGMLEPSDQEKIYAVCGKNLDEYHFKGSKGIGEAIKNLEKIVHKTLKPNKEKNKRSKGKKSSTLSKANQIPEELKILPARNYLVYAMINGIGYDQKRTTKEVATIMEITEDEVTQIYNESCQLLEKNKPIIEKPKEEKMKEEKLEKEKTKPKRVRPKIEKAKEELQPVETLPNVENLEVIDSTSSTSVPSIDLYIADNLKNLPAKNYLVYAMINGIGYSEKFSISKVAEVMKTSNEEIMRIYTEAYIILNNPSYQENKAKMVTKK